MLYDVAIIGGGPAGYTAAEKVASNGKSVILFEKNELGGVCLNEGCIPTKTLLYSAKIYDSFKSANKYGISLEGEASFDLKKIMSRKKKIVRKLTLGIKQKMMAHNVVVEAGLASLNGEDAEGNIQIKCNEVDFKARKVILCTGSESIVPPIPGLADSGFLTSREALDIETLPTSIAIIGGGVIGIEFASFFSSLGVEVSVIEMAPEILPFMDQEQAALLRDDYAKRGVNFYLGSKVVKVTPNSVSVEKDGETNEIATEKILLSTGRKAVLAGLNIESLNLETHRGGVTVDEHLLTSHKNVYACGDVNGRSLLAHTAIREAEVAANHMMGKDDKMCYNAIPAVVYTNPEISGVGATEEMLKAEGTKYRAINIPMAFSGRFVAENERVNGSFKMLVSEDDKVLGVHMLGNPSSEIIVAAGIAIKDGYTTEEFKKVIFPHPTVGEILHEALYL